MAPRRARRRTVVVVVMVLVGAAAVLAVVRSGPDDDPRRGSDEIGAGPPLDIRDIPEAYRIVYRLETGPDDDRSVSTERLSVRRPYEARLDTFDGDGTEGAPSTSQVFAFGWFASTGTGVDDLVVAEPPGVPLLDVRLEGVVHDGLAEGVLERREHRRVAGRRCQVHRTGALLRTGQLAPPRPDEHVDVCIDEAGLVLEELLVSGGRVTVRRVATEVEVEPDLDDEVFDVGEQTVPPSEGGGVVREVTAESRSPGTFWEAEVTAPLQRRGRYVVVPPQSEAFTDPTQRGRRVAAVVDVLQDGVEVVIVEQGGTLGGFDALEDVPDAPRVDLGPVGEGQVVLTPTGAEVRVRQPAGRFVRLRATTDVDTLLSLGRSLHAVPGGELDPVGGGG